MLSVFKPRFAIMQAQTVVAKSLRQKESIMTTHHTLIEETLDGPILGSLLDVDFYKFTMGAYIHQYHPDTHVKLGFTNRNKKIYIPEIVDIKDIEQEFDRVRKMRFSRSELHYLNGTYEYDQRMFSKEYIDFLAGFELPPYVVSTEMVEGRERLFMSFYGLWKNVTYWETIALSIINGLYFRNLLLDMTRLERDVLFAEGVKRLAEKVKILKLHPNLKFCDFGTRRRFSGPWQRYINEIFSQELPEQFIGTSNTEIAMKLGLLPMGTNAHELPMVTAALAVKNASNDFSEIAFKNDPIAYQRNNINMHLAKMLSRWYEMYGEGLSIALPDTFGSNSFFDLFFDILHQDNVSFASLWKGTRQDSGDPEVYGREIIKRYKKAGIDPRQKLLIFSDGLNIKKSVALHQKFHGQICDTYGIGTNLTNDFGLKPLQVVIKAIEAEGVSTVKISDDPSKIMGSPSEIMRYKQLFDLDK